MTDKPTDEALENLFVEETGFDIDDFPAAIFGFARAVLAKWGTPAPVGVGEVAERYRNAIASACEGWTMPDGLRKHLETALWSPPTPQPTQPQAGAVPLTDEQTKALMQAHRTAMLMTCKARVPECGEFAAIAQDLDLLCESFGIKGGQPAQAEEPVAWAFKYDDGTWHDHSTTEHSSGMRPLFAAPQPVAREPLTDEQIQDLLLCGNPTDEEMRLIRIGWDAASGIKGDPHG